MTDSRSPKFIGAKLGLASALALGALPMLGSEAQAVVGPVVSDTLQVGTLTSILFEGESTPLTNSITLSATFTTGTIFQTGTHTIALTEGSYISDLVAATIFVVESGSLSCGLDPPGTTYCLSVTLTSDAETSLTAPPGSSLVPETGGTQELTANFESLFGLNPGTLPIVKVSSDVEAAVPEPASLALFGSALAGFGLLRRRRKSA